MVDYHMNLPLKLSFTDKKAGKIRPFNEIYKSMVFISSSFSDLQIYSVSCSGRT